MGYGRGVLQYAPIILSLNYFAGLTKSKSPVKNLLLTVTGLKLKQYPRNYCFLIWFFDGGVGAQEFLSFRLRNSHRHLIEKTLDLIIMQEELDF